MITRVEGDNGAWVYWHELTKDWVISDHLASRYPRKLEAESRALQLVAEHPEFLGKLQVKSFYGDDEGYGGEQLELF